VVGSLVPEVSQTVRRLSAKIPFVASISSRAQEATKQAPGEDDHEHGHGPGEQHHDGPEGVVKISPAQIETAKIEVARVGKGVLTRRLTVPGTIAPDSNRIARVAAKVVGTVAELKKQLGDTVAKGEVVAILDSREVAEAKSEYISAQVNFELQKTLFEREQPLAEKKIIAENQFLRTRNTFMEAQLRVGLARQKLSALNLHEKEIEDLSQQTVNLQRYELRSPISGRIVERLVDLGAPVGGEGQAKELYVIADLSSVWIELSVSTADLPAIREGRQVLISTGPNTAPAHGNIVFISPMLNQDTRSARVIAAINNKDMTWRPGSYVTAQVSIEEQLVELLVPRTALQTINGEQVVFVRTSEGFEKREVALGRGDEEAVEIVLGLNPGESIAIANTFVLKAELGKAEAEHEH
jgi:cobalt-zinc-cadmium efflux system membrane fusion protein